MMTLKRGTALITYAYNTLDIKKGDQEKLILTEEELHFVQYLRKETIKANKAGKPITWETPFDYD